jgi:hypothetical protein
MSMRAAAFLAIAGVACSRFGADAAGDMGGADAAGADAAGADAAGADAAPPTDAGAGPCTVIASDEDVRGDLAPDEPALYWANGRTNTIRVFESGSVATLYTNTRGGVLTTVSVSGISVAWAADLGSNGSIHLDSLTTLGSGPSVVGLVPQSMQLVGSTVRGVALDRTQNNAVLFSYSSANSYDHLLQVQLPISNAERVNARETGEQRILCCDRGAERRSA